jgi:prophage maintenance system killer protein
MGEVRRVRKGAVAVAAGRCDQHFNLDVIISVGYRVKSAAGVRFRQWATRTLREHPVKGYTLNQKRLAERGLTEAPGLRALRAAGGRGLQAILGNIEQTMFGESLYRTREEKAANLLYLVIKDHPFIDGNKRCGAFLFMLYLQEEGIAHQLNAQALTALALLRKSALLLPLYDLPP